MKIKILRCYFYMVAILCRIVFSFTGERQYLFQTSFTDTVHDANAPEIAALVLA